MAGAGLAGLALADALHRAGVPVRVLEARSRAGGRIWSEGGFDLGPTWFWPGQRRMASLVDELGLERFEQPTRGTALLERGGQRHRLPPQQEMVSYRVAGGMGALAEGLLARLPKEALLLGRRVQRVRLEGTSVRVEAAGPEGVEVYAADAVALTLPPRLLAELAIEPALPREQLAELRAVPTWMAGTAKAVAVYDTPFWRERGFSGTAFSADGPLQEIHDATSPGGPAALFGFVGGTTAERGSVGAEALTRAIGEQLAR
ncbi:MAG: FAD-dependent oxidoreductase, partial [Myxococcota bacterium]